MKDETDGTMAKPIAGDLTMEKWDRDGIHRYSYVLNDCGWNEAFNCAQQAGGCFVHINSQEEFDYIVGQLEK